MIHFHRYPLLFAFPLLLAGCQPSTPAADTLDVMDALATIDPFPNSVTPSALPIASPIAEQPDAWQNADVIAAAVLDSNPHFGVIHNQTTQPYIVQVFVQGERSDALQTFRLASPLLPNESRYFANPFPNQRRTQLWVDVANSQPVTGKVYLLTTQQVQLQRESGRLTFVIENPRLQVMNLVSYNFQISTAAGQLLVVGEGTLASPLFSGESTSVQHPINSAQSEALPKDGAIVMVQALGTTSQNR